MLAAESARPPNAVTVLFDTHSRLVHTAVPTYVQGTPSATEVTDTSLHINVRLDTQGKYWWVILPRDATTPTVPHIKTGVDGAGIKAVVASGEKEVTTITLTFTDIVFKGLNLR